MNKKNLQSSEGSFKHIRWITMHFFWQKISSGTSVLTLSVRELQLWKFVLLQARSVHFTVLNPINDNWHLHFFDYVVAAIIMHNKVISIYKSLINGTIIHFWDLIVFKGFDSFNAKQVKSIIIHWFISQIYSVTAL